MFEGISNLEWLIGAAVASIGAGLIGCLRRHRYLLLILWIVAPAVLLTATSSFDAAGHLFELFVIYLIIPTLPWAVVAVLSFILTRLIVRWLSE